jgi:hypothetical protein
VYTQRGWVEAKDLTEKDDIFSIKDWWRPSIFINTCLRR